MKRLDKIPAFPFYVFLIPVFYVWHKLNEYFSVIPFSECLPIIAEYYLILLALIGILWLFLKRKKNVAIVSAFMITIYLFWGSIHDTLKTIFTNRFISSYTFLLPSLTLLSLFLLYFQRRKSTTPIKWTRYLNFLILLLLVIELATSIYNYFTDAIEKKIIGPKSYSPISASDLDTSKGRPDIYFIIFDEYPSSKALKEYLDFDNSQLDSFFNEKRFKLANSSLSNYNSTPISLASALNLDYFPSELERYPRNPMARLQGQNAMEESLIPRLLNEIGYEIQNFGLMSIPHAKSPYQPLFDVDKGLSIRSENLWDRVKKEIWWNFVIRFTFLQSKPEKKYEETQRRANITLTNYENLLESLDISNKNPKFVYAHFMLPHPPYIFDEKGRIVNIPYTNDSRINDSLFISHVKFSNRLIEEIVHKAVSKPERKKIVIILGDHGYRDYMMDFDKRNRDKQFMNLTAIYSSDQNYSGYYDSISPVNIFRVVLNQNFSTKLPLLKDSTIMLE